LKKVFCRELRRVSPHSPLAIVFTIKHDWEFAAPRANDWEKQFADSPQVQLLLGDRYLQEKEYADAIRCLERAAETRAELDVYQRLAAAWLEQKDEKQWQAAWDKFLTGETFGLAHARARVTVAEHFMMQGRFEEALPYAEAATATNSSWSLTCAGDCLSALKRYEEAEKYWEENAQRYAPDGYIMKYCWRQRVNWGKLGVSRDNIIAYMNRTGVRMSPAYELPFWVLVGEKEKAMKQCRQVLVQVPSPQIAWMAAILADELKDSRNRDISLQMVVDTGNKPEHNRNDLVDLAVLCQSALNDPSKLDALPKKVDALLASIKDPRHNCETAYLAGKFLDLRGKKVEGEALLRRAAESPFTQAESALAVKELRDREAEAKKGASKEGEKK
jgi:tetratricopeptide (TPR) repeat protein